MKARAYVDGSFNASTKVYGAGAVLFVGEDPDPIFLSQPGDNPMFLGTRNVAGEVLAATLVIEACKGIPHLEELTLYYDYSGIECWPKGQWRANSLLARAYSETTRDLPFRLSFRKVKAHSGDENNERADWLAKRACGLVGEHVAV